jgi:hypothetical protein
MIEKIKVFALAVGVRRKDPKNLILKGQRIKSREPSPLMRAGFVRARVGERYTCRAWAST